MEMTIKVHKYVNDDHHQHHQFIKYDEHAQQIYRLFTHIENNHRETSKRERERGKRLINFSFIA